MSFSALPPEIKAIIMSYKREMDELLDFERFFRQVMTNLLVLCFI